MALKLFSQRWRMSDGVSRIGAFVLAVASHLACGTSSNAPTGVPARLFSCGDASCSSASQYCGHTVGGAPPGVDFEICEPLSSGQAVCAKSPGNGCECEEDAGALYVRCDVP